jgi:hypothetical protein
VGDLGRLLGAEIPAGDRSHLGLEEQIGILDRLLESSGQHSVERVAKSVTTYVTKEELHG